MHEVLTLGYMAGVLAIHKLLSTPVIGSLADRVTVKMLINFKTLSEKDLFKQSARTLRESYKYYRIFMVFSRFFRFVRGISSPVTLLLSLGSPILFQQLGDLTREYIFHNAGRLILYGFEANALKQQQALYPLLW